MSIASRKEREFRERESLIIETAFDMLLEHGYIGFTIDKLAKKIDYAKGTIYKHFKCKEDIIVKILNEGFAQRQRVISRAKTFKLPERAIFYAAVVGAMLYNIVNPNLHKVIKIAGVGSIWDKVSPELKEEHSEMLKMSYDSFGRLLQSAQKNGYLDLGEHETVDIYYTLISIAISYDGLIKDKKYSDMPPFFTECFSEAELVKNAKKVLSLSLNTYMDGLNWRPLTCEYDYSALEKEVRNTIYSDLAELEGNGDYGKFIYNLC